MKVVPLSQPDLPVSVEDAKKSLRVTHSLDDALITGHIAAVSEFVSDQTGLALASGVFREMRDSFPIGDTLWLSRNPVLSVSEVEFVNPEGETETFSGFVADIHSRPARIVLNRGAAWATTAPLPNAVSIVYSAGYPSGQCPPDLVAAVQLGTRALYSEGMIDEVTHRAIKALTAMKRIRP